MDAAILPFQEDWHANPRHSGEPDTNTVAAGFEREVGYEA